MRRKSSKKNLYKNLATTQGERQVGELVVENYTKGGQEYVRQLRCKMRNLEASRKWCLYYSMERSIKYAMSLIEAKNDQWPLALLD